MSGLVIVYFSRLGTPMLIHEETTLQWVANAVAQLKRYEFGGLHDAAYRYSKNVYFVPDDTLIVDEAERLGIRSADDLFGGVVSHPFLKTKAITHQLIDSGVERPAGWSTLFAERVREVVLPGYTVFNAADAHAAAKRMLAEGPIRLKRPVTCGGRGQTPISKPHELDTFLQTFPPEEMRTYGLVLEANLHQVITLSVGQVTIGDMIMSYHGIQKQTKDNAGRPVYGGSELVCVRGGWEALADLPMTVEARIGVAQAMAYEAAMSAYPGFMASRRNYDVGQGLDAQGEWRSGVLESSWRSGGASTAELAALTAFVQDPGLKLVTARAVKQYGGGHEAPPGATVHFRSNDPQDGPIIRYTLVTRALRRAA
jgi:hypothetical protein